MAVNNILRNSYSRDIYLYGNRRFTDRDGVAGIPVEYHEPVKQYAAVTYVKEQITNALTMTWITQEEYDQTLAYNPNMPATSPIVN